MCHFHQNPMPYFKPQSCLLDNRILQPVVTDDMQERMNERIKYELYLLLLERGLR